MNRVSRRSRRDVPTCRSRLAAFPEGRSPAGKASCVGFWVLTPGPVPCRTSSRSPNRLDAPLGFTPFQGSVFRGLEPAFAGSPLSCLASEGLAPDSSLHLRVSIDHGPDSSAWEESPLLGFPHLPIPIHTNLSGLRAMGSPHGRHSITAVDRPILGACRDPTGVGGNRCRCRSLPDRKSVV